MNIESALRGAALALRMETLGGLRHTTAACAHTRRDCVTMAPSLGKNAAKLSQEKLVVEVIKQHPGQQRELRFYKSYEGPLFNGDSMGH